MAETTLKYSNPSLKIESFTYGSKENNARRNSLWDVATSQLLYDC